MQLSCKLDGSSSHDPDGTVASYAWNYGDGTTGTGVSPAHTYTTGGSHTVTLTVTDNSGATSSVSQAVSTNAPPTAAFSSGCTQLTCTFDGRGSSDSDGTIASYTWDFGDNTPTVSGAITTHTFTTGGSHTVSLTVVDNGGATSSSTQAVSTNDAPVAAFTGTCRLSSCSFDAHTSSDSDGTVASYAWTFGDGTTGTRVTTTHTYKTFGAHTVSLTVTDNGGTASKPVTHSVTTSPAVFASDGFNRTVKSGWGKADVGGTWAHSGCSATSVSSGRGVLVDRRTKTCTAWLPGVQRTATYTTATLRVPTAPKGSLQVAVIGRRVSAADDVRVRLDFEHDGDVRATLMSRVGSKATALSKSVTVKPPAKSTSRFHIEIVVSGGSPTDVRAKVWPDGRLEPSAWTITGSTKAAALQHKGSVGIAAYLPRADNPKVTTLQVSSFISRAVTG